MSDTTPTTNRPNANGDWPEVHPQAYIDPTAQVIGRVRIGPGVFVGPNAIVRADEMDADGTVKAITIEAESNIQDGVIIHALAGTGVAIGERTSVSHGAIIHGPCRLGDGCFVGFGAAVFKAEVGSGAFIGVRTVVEGVDIPADAMVPSLTCLSQDHVAQLRKVDASQREFMANVVQANLRLAQGYLSLLREQSRLTGTRPTGQSEVTSLTPGRST